MESEKIWRKGRLRGSGRDGRMYGTRAYVYATSSHYRTRPSRLPPLSTPPLSSVRCLLFLLFSRLLSSLESFHPPEIEKNLGGAEIG